jgi:sterol desaturase/sphingolipid hydroxylase (fatty acid hydroxylase superfamily)
VPVSDFIFSTLESLWISAQLLLLSALVFSLIALVFKGPEAIAAGRRAAREIRLNLKFSVFDVLFIGPFIALVVTGLRGTVDHLGLSLVQPSTWDGLGTYGTFLAAVFLGDFTGYWRHRLEHTPTLWPAHAIHHGDTQMSWTTLARFHPVNHFSTTAIDVGVLALLGFPMWALVANEIVRKYYGEFIHADLPWTYGPAGRLFVSPAMHQWHHARDVVGSGSNFATVFSVFDQAFGTFHLPGRCNVPLGVTEDLGTSLWSQLRFPFVSWAERMRRAPDLTARAER